MNKIYFIIKRFIYLMADIVSVCAAIYLGCLARQGTFGFEINFYELFLNQTNPFHLVFIAWPIAVIFYNSMHHLYQTKREVVESVELWAVIRSVFLSAVSVLVLSFSFKVVEFPRTAFLLIAVFSNIFLCTWRILKRLFVEYLAANGYNNFNVLIIGAGKVGLALADEVDKHPGFGFKIVGFLDDFKTTQDLQGQRKVLGKIDDFPSIARKEFINKVFITVHHDSDVFCDIMEMSRELGIAVRVIPQAFHLTTGEFCKYNIGFIPVLEYCDVEYQQRQFGKRLFDFILGLLAVIALLPLYLAIAILIKLDSPGPIFYKSKRYGRRGKMFDMYKFRSMVLDADDKLGELREYNEVDGPIFKMKKDPRITKLGLFLRKFSLDELPQFFNVLQGDMSIVGPRPLPIEQIEKEDLKQLKRLEVRPGITGLWQIRGRSEVSFSKLVKWDIWYINNWSFFLDLKIMILTIPAVFKGRGAY